MNTAPTNTFVLTPRLFFAATAFVCVALLGFGYYLQYHDGLEPCPMCIFQRLCYMGVAAVAFVGLIHGARSRVSVIYCALGSVCALLGAGIAGRQVWLQYLPADQIPECGPGLEFMLEVYPLAEVIRTALRGTGDCASVDWTFVGASIAEWSLLWFIALTVAQIGYGWLYLRHNR